MAVAICPQSHVLAAFARGDLEEPELSAVAEHVDACSMCCRALERVPDGSLAGLARAAAVHSTVHPGITPAAQPPPPSSGFNSGKIPPAFVGHPRYQIIGELGAGGMGTVYKAYDILMARTVAVKVVSAHLTAKATAVERFRREVQAAAQLEHVNIVRAYDTGEAGTQQFLVMEFVEGQSLARLVAKKGPLSIPLACALIRQAALGLQAAAAKGMVHRDIKPQNLMVTKRGQVKILDFGLARFANTESGAETGAPAGKVPFGGGKPTANGGRTNPNLLLGTPDYLSPEQAQSGQTVDPRSDIYSLGCTLYFLLTGRPPFGSATTLLEKLKAHTTRHPAPVRLERLDVTEELADVLAKMMAKKPDDRFQTGAEVAAALMPFVRTDAATNDPGFEVVVEAPAPPTVTPAPVAVPKPLPREADTARAPRPDRSTAVEPARAKKKRARKRPEPSRLKWGVLGGLAALAILVAGVVAAIKRPTDAPPVDPNADTTAKANPSVSPKGEKGEKSEKGDKAEKPDKGGKAGSGGVPLEIKPNSKKVLYVLPHDSGKKANLVNLSEYLPVRKRLEKNGITVKTCAAKLTSAKIVGDATAEPVPIDLLIDELNERTARDFDAIVFCGPKCDYSNPIGPWPQTLRARMTETLADGRVVGGIGAGTGVLLAHNILKDREAAICPALFGDRMGEREKAWDRPGDRPEHHKPPGWGGWPGVWGGGNPGGHGTNVRWKKEGVVTSGKVVTAAGGDNAEGFAEALLKAMGK
jgi:serine/threonine-protein kinase